LLATEHILCLCCWQQSHVTRGTQMTHTCAHTRALSLSRSLSLSLSHTRTHVRCKHTQVPEIFAQYPMSVLLATESVARGTMITHTHTHTHTHAHTRHIQTHAGTGNQSNASCVCAVGDGNSSLLRW